MKIHNPITQHGELGGIGTTDHHTATVAGDLNLASLNEKAHASLTSVGVDDHHAKAHVAEHDISGADSLANAKHFALQTLFS